MEGGVASNYGRYPNAPGLDLMTLWRDGKTAGLRKVRENQGARRNQKRKKRKNIKKAR